MKNIFLDTNFSIGFNVVAFEIKFKDDINFTITTNGQNEGVLAIIDKKNFRLISAQNSSWSYGTRTEVHPDEQQNNYTPIPFIFNSKKLIFLYIQLIEPFVVSEQNPTPLQLTTVHLQLHGDVKTKILFKQLGSKVKIYNKLKFIDRMEKCNFIFNNVISSNIVFNLQGIETYFTNINIQITQEQVQLLIPLIKNIILKTVYLNISVDQTKNEIIKICTSLGIPINPDQLNIQSFFTNIIDVIYPTKFDLQNYIYYLLYIYNLLKTKTPTKIYDYIKTIIDQ